VDLFLKLVDDFILNLALNFSYVGVTLIYKATAEQ